MSLLVLAVMFTAGASWSVHAQDLVDRRNRNNDRIEVGSVSLERAVEMVQSRYRARAVKADTVEQDGRRVHRIRLLSADKAKVWTVTVDAETGQVL